MKKLHKLPGYRDSEIKRFNKLYECLVEGIADNDLELLESSYEEAELRAFRAYVILAEADERKRREFMSIKRRIEDFTQEDIARFDHMQEVLTEFNRLLDDPDIELEMIMPFYSDLEMEEHSQYREIFLAHRGENEQRSE